MNTLSVTGGRTTRVILSLSTAFVLAGVGAVTPLVASADHNAIHTLEQQIAKLMDELNALKQQQQPPAGTCAFTRSLSQGVSGNDVKCLQQYLNSAGFQVAASGSGSPGNETMYFGSLTRAAVSKWQAANGVSPTAGYFGPISRAKYDTLVAGVPPPPPPPPPGTPPPPPPTGTGLTVASTAQPGDSIAPLNAARIPATKFTLTASADGDIKVNSITVERQGPAQDASVNGVVLIDEDGLQIGLSKTLNSNHQAILNESFTVKAGTTRTLTVGVNRPSSGSDGGDIAKMALVAVDAGAATVTGTLPIVGSPITMNSTLTIGTFSLAKGVNDPGSSQTKEVGTKGYIFTALRGTPSNEDVTVQWISWNQSGSAAASDLGNIVVNAGGTDYPVTVSTDGKYYTAKFGASGVAVAKGNNFEMYVKGDIIGGSNRGVDFDLYRLTDIYVVGKQFQFGITPTSPDQNDSQTDDDGTFDDDVNPVWDAYEATIGNGTITVTSSTAIPAQNIGVNLNSQPLGAWDVDVKGEAVTVSSIVIRVSTDRNDNNVTEVDFSSVGLYDNATGKIVAGPKDGSGTTDGQMIFTFTDAVSFPVGKRVYALKGKLSTDFNSDTLVSASTTPNSDWSSVKGDVTGASITPANTGTVSGSSYTVKTGAVTVALASSPTAQNVVRGAKAFTFANIIFDGANSGEDVRFTSAGVQYDAAVAGDLTNCQIFDGTTALNTGSNIQNPSTTGDKTFTFDVNMTVPKGGSKTGALKCDIPASGTGGYAQWTFSSNESFGATGLTSGDSITPALASSTVTNKMTLTGAGTFTITLDPSSPSVRLAQAGTMVDIAKIRLTSANEALDVKQIALQLSNTASNSPQDLVRLELFDGATKVGEVTATSSDTGLIIQTTGFQVPKDADKILTVKSQLANIGTNEPGRPGHLVTVNWDSVVINGNNATYAVGLQSSSNIYASGSDTAASGARVMRAYPTVNTTYTLPSGTFANGVNVLYRFSVTAPSGTLGVSLYKVTFNLSTSTPKGDTTPVNSLALFAFANSDFKTGPKFSSGGQLNNGTTMYSSDNGMDGLEEGKATTSDYAIYFNPVSDTSADPEAIAISAGETVYFELRGNASGVVSGSTVSTVLEGDKSFFGIANTSGGTIAYADAGFLAGAIDYGFATSAPKVDNPNASAGAGSTGAGAVGNAQTWTDDPGAGDNFIWSGNSTTTHSGAADDSGPDWHNGFVVPGLPASGGNPQALSK